MTPEKDNYYQMTPEREKHLESIKRRFCNDVDGKYKKGQAEHGGNLFQKDIILDELLKEALDLVVYVYSLKDKLENDYKPLSEKNILKAQSILNQIKENEQ